MKNLEIKFPQESLKTFEFKRWYNDFSAIVLHNVEEYEEVEISGFEDKESLRNFEINFIEGMNKIIGNGPRGYLIDATLKITLTGEENYIRKSNEKNLTYRIQKQ